MQPTKHLQDELPEEVQIQLNLVCNEFERRWQNGEVPLIEESLANVDAKYHYASLRELLPIDIDYRRRKGLDIRTELYRGNFPNLCAEELAALLEMADESQEAVLSPGRALAGRYEILESLGSGGMGQVYRAADTRLGRHVAIKMLKSTIAPVEVMRQRFNRELQIIAALSHPNIVKLFDVEEDEGFKFAVMEFIEGKTIRELMRDGVDRRSALTWVRDVAAGLAAAHACGIMHRDIKPENIIVASIGHAMVLDFGLARPQQSPVELGFTAGLAIIGTAPYMSPEQADGDVLSCATDLFSLGIVLFEMLSGANPYRAESARETLRILRNTTSPPLLHDFGCDYPPEVATLVSSLLRRDPAARPSAETVRLAAETALTKSGSDLDNRSLGVGHAPVNVAGIPTNIPLRTAVLTGREQEVAEGCVRLRNHPIVTVLGPGGVGKTSVALEVARQCLHNYPGGVWLCEFAALREAKDIDQAVASAVDGNAGSADESTEIIAKLNGPVLLVFDNCEHVIDVAADLAERLRARAPQLSILATSRELLDVPGEFVMRLEGLGCAGADSDAAKLFSSRAATVGGVAIASGQNGLVEEIVAKLEGLPLAIELAASRLVSMSLEELHDEMDDQMTALRRRRKSDNRQSTIDRAIAWSFNLLNSEEKEMLLALSAFASSFTKEAALEVSRRRTNGGILLRALVEKSVVARIEERGKSRYRLLEPIRQFCQARVSAAAETITRERHARYYAGRAKVLGRGIVGENEIECTASLNHEWPDLRRAIAWGREHEAIEVAVDPIVQLAHTVFFQVRVEAFRWLDEAIEVFGTQATERGDVNYVLALAKSLTDDLAQAEKLLEKSEEIELTAQVELTRYSVFASQNRMKEAVEAILRGRALAEAAGDPLQLRWFQNSANLAVALAFVNPDDPRVDEELKTSEEFLATIDWPTGESILQSVRGTIELSRNNATSALTHLNRAVKIAQSCGNRTIESLSAQLATGIDDLSRPGIDRLASAVNYLRTDIELGDSSMVPLAVRSVIVGLVDLGHFRAAAQCSAIVDSLVGAGANNELSPRYPLAISRIIDQLGKTEFDKVQRERSNLKIADIVDLAEEILNDSGESSQRT